ncbi:non-ribosomal peptide synthetase [Pedobacter cryoconitis]|uniref:Amino acid adenylation domain-containing protein/thioester reductase-like protein n=1 Tax=Pedobacter cryoconitis TaxID=188932 RepID=A0A327SPB8_9SPHI|nr:non-ribosomal peptide synthetase [Pedobacter cryoconitis]RAJ31130.1 amino acid adenylation domain-containing protein/thioester reductase-like protein [Pedobacter cryoconitis]
MNLKNPKLQDVFDQAETVVQIFERRVLNTPGKVILEFKDRKFDYQSINERANQLAHFLNANGGRHQTKVGICLHQSEDRLIAMLAVLKIGGIYVPLDTNYPASRFQLIFEDTGIPFLITETSIQEKLENYSGQLLDLDCKILNDNLKQQSKDNLIPVNKLDDVAYILYTSGSTGIPKGVVVKHRGLTNFVSWYHLILEIEENSKSLQFASISFDAVVIDLWIPVLYGVTVCLYPDNRLLGDSLLDFIAVNQINIIPTITPSVLATLTVENKPNCLRLICMGGEAANEILVKKWADKVVLLNAYGPTECTVAVCYYKYKKGDLANTIGKPCVNTQFYVLNEMMEEVEVGETGELFITGEQVAKEYLNRKEETRLSFIPNKFDHAGKLAADWNILYKTGDLVKYLADGNVEFVGRKDSQIKLRGYRIELEEIESVIKNLAGVKQSVVLLQEDNYRNKLLVAFIVQDNNLLKEEKEHKAQLLGILQDLLPVHMIPSKFQFLNEMPLNVSGKIDRNKLFLTEQIVAIDLETFEPEDYESIIISIWSAHLQLTGMAAVDNVFSLGGDSLRMVQVYADFPASIKKVIKLQDLYLFPVIKDLADEIRVRHLTKQLTEQESVEKSIAELLDDSVLKVNFNTLDKHPESVLIDPKHIFLTGATGFVGSCLLNDLLNANDAIIYCLVRAENYDGALARIKHTFEKFLLPWDKEKADRIFPVLGELSEANMGMSAENFSFLEETIEIIYHSGSSVSYLQPYQVIKKSNIDGLNEILKLAAGKKLKYLMLLSTMGVFSWGRPFTNSTFMNEDSPIDQNLGAISRDLGYIKSKWVMEKIIEQAIKKGLPVVNFRLGFAVCNGKTGATVMNQWWGMLTRSCIELNAFPLVMGLKDELTTVDYMSSAIVHIAKNKDSIGKNFHLSSLPENDVSLTDFCSRINEFCGHSLQGIPFDQWLNLWKHDVNNPLYPLLALFTDDIYSGKSLVEAYENTYYYTRLNTEAFLKDTGFSPPVFDSKLITAYLNFMKEGVEVNK